jgi:hypothetical protein
MRTLRPFVLAWSLLASCTPSLEKRMREPATYPGTNTPYPPDFYFKGIYDSTEIFQKRGVYYTRLGRNLKSKFVSDTLVSPQKMQGGVYIYTRSPAIPPARQGDDLGFWYGHFLDGRKDGEWFHAKFVKVLVSDSTIQTRPSPDSTVIEEYHMGKLLRCKRGAPYQGSP